VEISAHQGSRVQDLWTGDQAVCVLPIALQLLTVCKLSSKTNKQTNKPEKNKKQKTKQKNNKTPSFFFPCS
jgi:outer membrane biogenesis lipoprotein LolB